MGLFRRKLEDISTGVVGYFVVIAVLAIVAAIWAIANSWAGPIVIILVLGVISLGLFICNQIYIIKQRRIKGLADQGNKEIENTVRDWLDDPFFKFQRKDDPKCLFMFIVTDEQGRPVTISRLITKPTQIHLATAITLGKEHRKTYETLSHYEKEKILYNLRIEMARYGIGYSGIEINLERVVLTDTVLLDNSLTEFYLKQRIFYVTGAFVLYGQRIGQQLLSSGEQEAHKEDSRNE